MSLARLALACLPGAGSNGSNGSAAGAARRRLLAAALLAGGPASGAEAGDWPQYRGLERQGSVEESGLLAAWPAEGPRRVWRRAVGAGYSAVSAVGDRLYTMAAVAGQDAVVCLEGASGDTVWEVRLGEPLTAELGDSGPRSTPAVADGMVYAVSSKSRLVALATADGRLVWERDLTEWGPVPRFGYSVSPLVEGELVVVEVGERDESPGVAAFDRRTGELRWTALEGPTGYSSPIAVEIAGVRQIVLSRGTEVVGLSLAGEVLWRHQTPPRTAIPMPLFQPPDRIFVASADDHFGGLMLRVVHGETGFVAGELWSERLMRNHFNTSVRVGDEIYGFDNATLRCLDAATGEQRWAKRGFGKGSLVATGRLLYVLSDEGTVALVEATPEAYRESGRVRATEGRAWTAPSLAGGRLYVRDFDELVSFDLRGDGAGGAE